MSVFIIAEAGVNHNGDIRIAKELVDKAALAGVDCVKFQTFVAGEIVSKFAKKAAYQIENEKNDKIDSQNGEDDKNNQLEMLKRLELSFDDFIELKKYCEGKGIEFLSTPFDFASIDFLKSLNMSRWKVPSGEITNLPYLIKIANTRMPVILSTGMSTIEEIAAAMEVLTENGSGKITLLHCTTQYPTPFDDVNLNVIDTLRKRFGVPVGYSDHTTGIEVPIAAVALGAVVIEKHFTLDRTMKGPDHNASLEPDELKAMVGAIRNIEAAMGTGEKKPAESEIKNIMIARKSIISSRKIKKGEIFSEYNVTTKRPGGGMSPMRWFEVIGQVAGRDFDEDEFIEITE